MSRLVPEVDPSPLFVSEGRLTITSGTPVTTSDVTGAGTIYFAPFKGNRVRLFNGAVWQIKSFTERSLSLTLTSGKNYDVFLYDNAGTLTLELSAAWTNDTTRADALVLQDGVYVKSGATTRLYLGTIRASAANQTEDSGAKRFVWNMYNQVARQFLSKSTTTSWTYGSATLRLANGSTESQVECVTGLTWSAFVLANVNYVATGSADCAIDFGVSSTTARHADSAHQYNTSAGYCGMNTFITHAALGYRYYALLESSPSSLTYTMGGSPGTNLYGSVLG